MKADVIIKCASSGIFAEHAKVTIQQQQDPNESLRLGNGVPYLKDPCAKVVPLGTETVDSPTSRLRERGQHNPNKLTCFA